MLHKSKINGHIVVVHILILLEIIRKKSDELFEIIGHRCNFIIQIIIIIMESLIFDRIVYFNKNIKNNRF